MPAVLPYVESDSAGDGVSAQSHGLSITGSVSQAQCHRLRVTGAEGRSNGA